VDVLEKPVGDETNGDWERTFIATVKLIARIKVITHPRARLAPAGGRPTPITTMPVPSSGQPRVVAIGVSTGGPAALLTILHGLPRGFPLPILLVIHIGRLFAPAFAEWLDGQSPFRVSYARDGDVLPAVGQGRVLVAYPGFHLVLRQGRLRFTQDPERHSCRPAVDVLFDSLALELGDACVACLLTGMGKDGAAGLLAVRRAGGRTIAQDEATSVVFGMPKEAILLGAAEQILPLDRIGPALGALARMNAAGRA
jgi:two-component system chemotaxis response regulator CheB